MGFSNYPSSIDGQTSLPVTTDLVTQVRAEVVNRLRDAVIATQAELGTQPSGIFGTVKARLDALRSGIETIKAELGPNPSGIFDTVEDRLNNIDAVLNTKANIPVEANDLDASQRITIPLSYNEQVAVNVFTAIGGDTFNPSVIPNPDSSRVITFRATILTTSASNTVTVRLFNVTDGLPVTIGGFTSTSLTPDSQKVVLSVPADLPNSAKTYEVQLKLASTGSDIAICQKAELIITWT